MRFFVKVIKNGRQEAKTIWLQGRRRAWK